MGISSKRGTRKPMTKEEVSLVEKYFEEGRSVTEICNLTGYSDAAIVTRRKAWRLAHEAKTNIEHNESETKKEEDTSILNSDYAKKYLDEDWRWGRSNTMKIRKTIEIRSEKTGTLYEYECGSDVIRITINDSSIEVPKKIFDAVIDEMTDVFIECSAFCK